MPAIAVAMSHSCDDSSIFAHVPVPAQPGLPLFCTAANASTMNKDDISSTNVDIDVTGMLRIGLSVVAHCGGLQISCGNGPLTLRPLYERYVEISDVKSMHSEPMKAQMAILRWSSPVVVGGWPWPTAAAVAISARPPMG